MKIVIFQTSDPEEYTPLLKISGQHNRRYCEKWGYDYKDFIGIKKGRRCWNAKFNRIYMLEELVGKYDLAFYLDADAVVKDHEQSLEDFFEKHGQTDLMDFCKGASDKWPWDINSGVFFANLNNPGIKNIISLWKYGAEQEIKNFYSYIKGSEALKAGCRGDQAVLQMILKTLSKSNKVVSDKNHHCYFGIRVFVRKCFNLFNYHGKFVWHEVAGNRGTIAERAEILDNLFDNI